MQHFPTTSSFQANFKELHPLPSQLPVILSKFPVARPIETCPVPTSPPEAALAA